MVIRPSWGFGIWRENTVAVSWAALLLVSEGIYESVHFLCVCWRGWGSCSLRSIILLLLLWSSKCHQSLTVSASLNIPLWCCHFLWFSLFHLEMTRHFFHFLLRCLISLHLVLHHHQKCTHFLLLYFLLLCIIPLATHLPSAYICSLQSFRCGFQWAELEMRKRNSENDCQQWRREKEAEWRAEDWLEKPSARWGVEGKFGRLCPSLPDVTRFRCSLSSIIVSFTFRHICINICVTFALSHHVRTPIMPECSGLKLNGLLSFFIHMKCRTHYSKIKIYINSCSDWNRTVSVP